MTVMRKITAVGKVTVGSKCEIRIVLIDRVGDLISHTKHI